MKCVCVKSATFAEFCSKLAAIFRGWPIRGLIQWRDISQRAPPNLSIFPPLMFNYFCRLIFALVLEPITLADLRPVADLGAPRCAPPYGLKFSQFHAVFRKIWQNHMLAPPGGLAPPPMGNPGFAPVGGPNSFNFMQFLGKYGKTIC